MDDEAQHSAEQKVNIMSWSGSMWREEADEVTIDSLWFTLCCCLTS